MSSKLTARQRDKLLESAQNAITFTVEGSGNFPVDMLRYDICWPATEGDSHQVATPEGVSEASRTSRVVTLKGLKAPTLARWRSFGWMVVEES
jgi:hypothetical protein